MFPASQAKKADPSHKVQIQVVELQDPNQFFFKLYVLDYKEAACVDLTDQNAVVRLNLKRNDTNLTHTMLWSQGIHSQGQFKQIFCETKHNEYGPTKFIINKEVKE